MSIIYSSSFESPETLAQIFDNGVGTTASLDSAHVFSGTRAVKIHQTGVASASSKLIANLGVSVYRLAWYMTVNPPSANQNIFVVVAADGVNLTVVHKTTGIVGVSFIGGTQVNTLAVTLNQWNFLDFLVDETGTTRTCAWKLNGVDQTLVSSPVQAAGTTATAIRYANSGANTFDYWYDVLVIGNSAGDYPLPNPNVPAPSFKSNKILLDLLN